MFATVVAYIAFGCVMVAIAVTDVRTLQIANRSVLLLVGLWALWRIALGAEAAVGGFDFLLAVVEAAPLTNVSLAEGVLGAIILGGGLLVFTTIWEAFTKKAAMGGGDIKLLAAMGLFLGIAGGLAALAVACIVFAIVGMAKQKVPLTGKPYEVILSHSAAFAPALATGAWVSMAFLLAANL
ncbi:prepilin peptidase [Parvibacter caecicola]|uniref:Prepilin type IV endopeptidase peptidase domain-containing protein n=1 Tax=Parvibacter caecicola TaxID=747645 RepID=A0A4T9T6T7_9ACTN|nr:prepilin peptidase [Parvibacter caecicola]TJW10211.1 hypothetical protein E5982_06510 [Parvibacter caecicola]